MEHPPILRTWFLRTWFTACQIITPWYQVQAMAWRAALVGGLERVRAGSGRGGCASPCRRGPACPKPHRPPPAAANFLPTLGLCRQVFPHLPPSAAAHVVDHNLVQSVRVPACPLDHRAVPFPARVLVRRLLLGGGGRGASLGCPVLGVAAPQAVGDFASGPGPPPAGSPTPPAASSGSGASAALLGGARIRSRPRKGNR